MPPLAPDRESAFKESVRSVRARLGEAIDLLLIHNEKPVRGNQPRRVLGGLTLLLAVSAWERLIADLVHLASSTEWPGAERAKNLPGKSYPQKAFELLGDLTDGSLPNAFRIRLFNDFAGQTPHGAWVCGGDDDTLAQELNGWIASRNGVAHHCLPQQEDKRVWVSDADGGHTVNTSLARSATSTMIQLCDQAVQQVASAANFALAGSERFPEWWFAAEIPAGTRGSQDPGRLWGSYELLRSVDGTR